MLYENKYKAMMKRIRRQLRTQRIQRMYNDSMMSAFASDSFRGSLKQFCEGEVVTTGFRVYKGDGE